MIVIATAFGVEGGQREDDRGPMGAGRIHHPGPVRANHKELAAFQIFFDESNKEIAFFWTAIHQGYFSFSLLYPLQIF
jgi:hypothetical protein